MEENQVEYTKELMSLRDQVDSLTKERDELKQENEELKVYTSLFKRLTLNRKDLRQRKLTRTKNQLKNGRNT